MISLASFGYDNNLADGTGFCGIPQPVGVRDGDIVVVVLATIGALATVAPPDDSWTKIAQTDTSQSLGLCAYWHTALNDGPRYVFTMGAGVQPWGGVLVYRGVDPFQPIEAVAASINAAAATTTVASATAPLAGEEAIIFLAAAGDSAYTVPTGWREVVSSTEPGLAFSVLHRGLPVAGSVGVSSVALSGAFAGASITLILRPGVGLLSVDDVRGRIVDAFPAGVKNVYDLEPGGDYYLLFQAIALVMKEFAFDLLDLMRLEVIPSLSRYKLPDWERVFGLETTTAARVGTIPERQAQVVSAFRAAAGQGSSIPELQGVLAPLLGYVDSSDLQVVESSRATLTAAHTYVDSVETGTPPSGNPPMVRELWIFDGGPVAKMGARLCVKLSHTAVETVAISLTSPTGTVAATVALPGTGAATGQEFWIFCPEFIGEVCAGRWQFTIVDTDGAETGVIHEWRLFVEGCPGGLGDDIFDFAPYADPALIGQSGVSADYTAAQAAVDRLQQSHTIGRIIRALRAYPGTLAAIPGLFLPY